MSTPYRKFFSPEEQLQFLYGIQSVSFRRCPPWLGTFQFKIYGHAYGKDYGKLPPLVKPLALKLGTLVDQQFTTVFVQKYETGSYVKKHRDPKNNVGYTVLGIFGAFTGATTSLYSDTYFQLESGDALVQACTINGVQGPPHEVSPVTSGTRYALILNTIE